MICTTSFQKKQQMKKILFFYFITLLGSSAALLAQGGLRLESNVRMVCDGAVNVVLEDGRFNNVSGVFIPGESNVKFTGTASTDNSLIQGKPFEFYNLTLHKSSNDVRLAVKMSINNQLIFSQGDLDLNNKQVGLNVNNGYNGRFSSESELSHTYGTASLSKVSKKITTTGPSQLSFVQIGLRLIGNGNFGTSTVERLHTAQSLPTGSSILKYWRVTTASTPAAQNGTVELYYYNAEVNGLDESTFSIWRSTDNGLTWTDMGFSARSAAQNYIHLYGVADIEGWWTIGTQISLQGPAEVRNATTDDTVVADTWSISPNPAADFTTALFYSEIKESVFIHLYDASGKMVLSTPYELQPGENSCQLDLGSLSPGTYFAQIAGKRFKTISVVKGY